MYNSAPVWQDNNPDRLLDLCVKFCIQNPGTFCAKDPLTNEFHLHNGISLPMEICEKMFEVYQQYGNHNHDNTDEFISIFHDTGRTRLRHVSLKNSSVTDDGIASVFRHSLVELDISDCKELSEQALAHINENGNNLLSLIVGTTKIFPRSNIFEYENSMDLTDFGPKRSEYHKRGYIINCPSLRKFVVEHLDMSENQDYFPLLLKSLVKLVHLDLSRCHNIESLSYLLPMKNLRTLILFDVSGLQDSIKTIPQLRSLR